jgi:SRSO17 transposase
MGPSDSLCIGWDAGGSAVFVAEWTGSLLAWEQELVGLKARLAGAFGRAELRRSAGAFIDGALSGVARKTGWQLAEQAGLDRPYRLQSLLGRSAWEADGLRDLVRAEVLTALGDAGGVLVVDESGNGYGRLRQRRASGASS